MGAPHDRVVGNVLAKKRGEVWAIESKFGLVSGLRAAGPGLLSVRRGGRSVEGGVRAAAGGGEDVVGSEVGARNEAGNLCSAVQSQD